MRFCNCCLPLILFLIFVWILKRRKLPYPCININVTAQLHWYFRDYVRNRRLRVSYIGDFSPFPAKFMVSAMRLKRPSSALSLTRYVHLVTALETGRLVTRRNFIPLPGRWRDASPQLTEQQIEQPVVDLEKNVSRGNSPVLWNNRFGFVSSCRVYVELQIRSVWLRKISEVKVTPAHGRRNGRQGHFPWALAKKNPRGERRQDSGIDMPLARSQDYFLNLKFKFS